MILRLSSKLAAKIKEPSLTVAPPCTNPFLDWHCSLFIHNRAQYIIITNSSSLFSVFMHGAGNTNIDRFCDNMVYSLRSVLEQSGFSLIYDRIIIPSLNQMLFAKPNDQRIIGSMNELIFQARVFLDMEDLSPYELSHHVNKVIMGMIHYRTPQRAFAEMKFDKT
jgi:hypothetical protein